MQKDLFDPKEDVRFVRCHERERQWNGNRVAFNKNQGAKEGFDYFNHKYRVTKDRALRRKA